MPKVPFSTLLGKTLTAVERTGDDSIDFTASDGSKYSMYHCEDCCESVTIEDIAGELSSLVGSPILRAEESTNFDNPKPKEESHTWTFYKLATVNGWVDIRWYGSSNGYYSESVDFVEVMAAK